MPLHSSLGDRARFRLKKQTNANKKKIDRAWWNTPVVPAIQEAEVGESLEPAWEVEAAVSRDHTTAFQPGQWSKTLCQKRKKKENHLEIRNILFIK